MAEEEQEATPEQLEEEFSVWKKNTPFLYDLVISHPLEWPSLTIHWNPSWVPQPYAADPSFSVHKLVLGTHTSDDVPNFLMIADAVLPTSESEGNCDGNGEITVMPKVEIAQKIHVDGEVNRARWMPQNSAIVGAKTSGSEVYVFDCTKQAEKQQGVDCYPDLRLRGHDKEGYGLSWSPLREGYLLSGSHDQKICLWDVSAMAQNKVLDAMHVYEAHESVVEDVSWHLKNEKLFGSVGDDCQLIIWDLRTNEKQQSVKAHEREVNYISFNPFNEWILATASSDATVGLFDMRKLDVPLHALGGHTYVLDVFSSIYFPDNI
ncbi:WD-40 repeat-containing protein MSI3-like [Tripterygium wilfordii]|uniref:WD-40 repeat-containing protein MSI3-like n=1 Tax=Tripterygium wilfordii TaxID=458696 RepID=A0A7J7DG64_TRIWF|nr:WD-40 repeat-containing protein MSI3-like [Tripterygium wilfordii]